MDSMGSNGFYLPNKENVEKKNYNAGNIVNILNHCNWMLKEGKC